MPDTTNRPSSPSRMVVTVSPPRGPDAGWIVLESEPPIEVGCPPITQEMIDRLDQLTEGVIVDIDAAIVGEVEGFEAPTTPLLILCPDCDDGTRWVSRHGGNDPDVSPIQCDRCGGEGEILLCCDGCPDPEAVGWFAGFKWCQNCLDEQKADTLYVGEDA